MWDSCWVSISVRLASRLAGCVNRRVKTIRLVQVDTSNSPLADTFALLSIFGRFYSSRVREQQESRREREREKTRLASPNLATLYFSFGCTTLALSSNVSMARKARDGKTQIQVSPNGRTRLTTSPVYPFIVVLAHLDER